MTVTDEFRRILDKIGIEYEQERFDGVAEHMHVTKWDTQAGNKCTFCEVEDGHQPYFTRMFIESPTAEQAIAATVGKEPDDAAICKLHDRMNAALLKYERALGGEKADSTITVPLVAEMHHLLEEAATVGVGTCRRVFIKDWLWECSECHSRHDSGHLYNFCPNCGARIEAE